MSRARQWAALGAGAALLVLVTAASAWACVAGPTLRLTPASVKPGEQVTLSGISYKSGLPIVVRFNALDGPLLGTFMPSGGRFGDDEFLNGTVTIPADVKPGSYVLVATQSGTDGKLAQVPVRALVTVTGPGGNPAVGGALGQPELGRPVGPARTESSVSAGTLLLVAVGVAGVGMFLAGIAAVFMSGRRPEAAPARTTR
jgi:hypothetical protein